MVSVGIISLILAIAIPNLLRSRIQANEANAIKALRTLSAAFESFFIVNGRYPRNFAELADANPPYIDYEVKRRGYLADWIERQGYRLDMCVMCSSEYNYIIEAKPLIPQKTGKHWYRITESGQIEVKDCQSCEYTPLK